MNLTIGVKAEDIDVVSERLKPVLGSTAYERRDSSFKGEYNVFRCPEALVVKYNFVPQEEEWDEPEFREFTVLVSVAETDRQEHFVRAVADAGFENVVIRRGRL